MANADIKVVIKKTFSYRGNPTQVFSNDYCANGGVPADDTHWNTLFDAIVNAEKLVFGAEVTIVEAVGYVLPSAISAHSKSYNTVGTASVSGNPIVPGDCAAIVRYSTAARTSKGHPVYLFNYYHGIRGSATPDEILAAQKTLLETYATDWWSTGFSDGTNTYKRAGPRGADATARVVSLYYTHRDFPR